MYMYVRMYLAMYLSISIYLSIHPSIDIVYLNLYGYVYIQQNEGQHAFLMMLQFLSSLVSPRKDRFKELSSNE
jgi:hypothetical protein